MEKRISSKINYDVLKDLADGFSSSSTEGSLDSVSSSSVKAERSGESDGALLPITRTPMLARGRLPSLSARKRTFSALEAAGPEAK